MSACGGDSTLCPVVLYEAGDAVEGRVGSADGRVREGDGIFLNKLESPALGPSIGPKGPAHGVSLGLPQLSGLRQGSFKGTQEDLGCDLRPNVSYGEKGEGFGSVGPDAAEGGDLNGEGFSSPRARAQSPGVEKGSGVADSLVRGEAPSASRPSAQLFSSERRAFTVEDPIVDNMRAASQSVAFAVPKMTDQALRDEASRYVGLPSVGGRESSPSSLSSGIDRAGTNEGVSSGLISEIEGEEQLPLSIILADGCNGEMGPGGERPSGDEGRGDEFEILLQDLEGRGSRWDDSCLARFSKFLGFSTEGFEGKILNLLLRNKRRREQNIKKDISGSTKFDRELKKLEWSINYKGARKEKSLVRDGGDRISNLR